MIYNDRKGTFNLDPNPCNKTQYILLFLKGLTFKLNILYTIG